MDQGARFVIETLRKALELAKEKPELNKLLGKVRREYYFVKDAKKTGDLYDYFINFEGDVHKDSEMFKIFEEYNLTTNEQFARVLRENYAHEIPNRTYPEDFEVGKVYNNNHLRFGFKVAYQGGIRISNRTNTIVLVAKQADDGLNDGWQGDIFYYTGQAQDPNKPYMRGNKALHEAKEKERNIHFFEMLDDKEYTYRGKVYISDEPYYESKDQERFTSDKKHLIFPIKLINS